MTHAIKLATNLSERWDAAIPAIKERNDADPARAQQVKEGLEDTIKCATIREKCRKAIETVSYDSPISETVIRNRNKVADFLRSIGLKYKQGTPMGITDAVLTKRLAEYYTRRANPPRGTKPGPYPPWDNLMLGDNFVPARLAKLS